MMPATLRSQVASPGRLTVAALVCSLVVELTAGAGAAHAASRVILSPRPAAKIQTNTVLIAVRAGPEYSDVQARLNGASVGGEFARRGKSLRLLRASASDGLRPGRNVLRITARWQGRIRHAVVRFRVMHRYLAGAGRDVYVPVGMLRPIVGRIAAGVQLRSRPRSRWSLVAAPLGSRYARRLRKRMVAGGRSPAPRSWVSVPLGALGVRLATLGPARAPAVALRPDVPGIYRLRMTTSVGTATMTDNVDMAALPRSPVLEVNTNPNGRPGIQLGNTFYAAPPMAGTPSNPRWSGSGYQALWQLIAVDRRTMVPLWDRTYGACGNQICRIGSGDRPVPVDVEQELESLGDGAMVIAASHPIVGWGPPNTLNFATSTLAAIGFPSQLTLGFPVDINNLKPGTAAAIGVPGLAPGDAQIDVTPNRNAVMQGYLGSDANHHYSFMPAARESFDTRAAAFCSGGIGGTCTIAQTIGSAKVTGTVANSQGGYLVSAWDEHTLALQHSIMFVTTDENGPQYPTALRMAGTISQWSSAGSVIMISSLRTPGLGSKPLIDPDTPTVQLPGLAQSIAAVGGTRDTFNRSMGFSTASYSLVGWSGAGEGRGTEVADGNGRLRGALAPNTESLFRPHNVSSVGPPAEQLVRLVLRPPVQVWPLDNNPGAHAALDWIGSQVPELADSPRQAYWTQTISLSLATAIKNEINSVHFEQSHSSFNGVSFTAADFAAAQQELAKEIIWVGKVRHYLAALAAPETAAGAGAWEQASVLQDNLEKQLANLNAKAQLRFDWFSIASSVAYFLAPWFNDAAERVVNSFAAATDLSDSLFQGLWGGTPGTPQDRRVEADKLGMEIQSQAANAAFSYRRMGDMIVSDPTKLALLGHWALCDTNGGCGTNGQYDEFSLSADAQTADGTVATQAVERELYRDLVPLAFPVWNTGKTAVAPGAGDVPDHAYNPVISWNIYWCASGESDDPFLGSPAGTRWASLQTLDPNAPGASNPNGFNVWQVSLMVARSGSGPGSYAWPSKTILNRMFSPVSPTNAGQGGLGVRPADVMLRPVNVYVPGVFDICKWVNTPRSNSG